MDNSKEIEVLVNSLELANRIRKVKDYGEAYRDIFWEKITNTDIEQKSLSNRKNLTKTYTKSDKLVTILEALIDGVNGLYTDKPDEMWEALLNRLD